MNVTSISEPQNSPRLRLYLAGDSPGARRALESSLRLTEALQGKVEIQIVNVLELPEEAEKAGIMATPTLSDESIDPPRRLVGDLGNIEQVLEYFGYRKKDSAQ